MHDVRSNIKIPSRLIHTSRQSTCTCSPHAHVVHMHMYLKASIFILVNLGERPKSLIEEPTKNVYTNVFSLNLTSLLMNKAPA